MSRQPENSPPDKGEYREAGRGLVPRLRFPEFREDGEWSKEKIGAVASLHKGKGISKAEIVANGIHPCIRYGELYTIYGETIHETISSTNVDASELFLSKRNDVIIPASGETKIDIAKASCVMSDDIALGGDLNVIRSSQNGIFFSYQLNGPLRLSIAKVAQGDTVVHLYPTQIGQLDVFIPSLNEQQKIADCLSSLDDLITAEAQKLDTLKVHKKGLMQQLFPSEGETVPKLRFPEFREAGEWEEKTLSALAENLDNRRIPVTESDRIKGAIPYYGASGIVDYIHNFIFDEDLLCISEDGANLVSRSTPIAFSITGKTWVNNHAHVLKFASRYVQKIVEDYLNLISLEDYLTGMAQPKLNRAMLDTIPVPIPPDECEQQKIASCLSSLDDLITAQTQKIDLLKSHKKGLMQQLFPSLDEVQG